MVGQGEGQRVNNPFPAHGVSPAIGSLGTVYLHCCMVSDSLFRMLDVQDVS